MSSVGLNAESREGDDMINPGPLDVKRIRQSLIREVALNLTHLNKFSNIISLVPAARALARRYPNELTEAEAVLMIIWAADTKRVRVAWMLPTGYPHPRIVSGRLITVKHWTPGGRD